MRESVQLNMEECGSVESGERLTGFVGDVDLTPFVEVVEQGVAGLCRQLDDERMRCKPSSARK